jgi:YHS domain-containing protein
MFRGIFRFIALLIVFALIRYVIVTVARFFSQVMSSSQPSDVQAGGKPVHGELKKDPVCGTFVSTATSVKETVNGELMHFCSTACRDKYRTA